MRIDFDKLTDINLKLLVESEKAIFFRTEFVDLNGNELEYNVTLLLAIYIAKAGLIELENEKQFRCDITPFGNLIYKKGGWLEHLKTEEIKAKRIIEKEKLDFNLSKWRYRTFWIALLLITVIERLSKLESNQQEQKTIIQSELEQSTLHTSISDQKSQDSLRNPNLQPDSLRK
jgi:hypothetical protein